MTSKNNARKAAAVLGHPVILQGAWMRVESWYRTGELAPQPELSRWRLHPEAMLRELAEALRDDRWKPEQWRQVPYPKKGARLRHYVMPTCAGPSGVRGPHGRVGANPRCTGRALRIRKSLVPANRLGSPGRTARVGAPSIPRAHGQDLPFVPTISWVVSARGALDGGSNDKRDVACGRRIRSSTHSRGLRAGDVTAVDGKAWWRGTPDTSRAFWAALDIELAYPSVRINRLAVAMERALRRPVDIKAGELTDISMDDLSRLIDFQRLFERLSKTGIGRACR